MKSLNFLRSLVSAMCVLIISVPAWATWDGEVVVTGTTLQDVKNSSLSFTSNGQDVPVTVKGEDDDGNVILIIGFGGNSATAGSLKIGGDTIATPAAGPGQNIYVNTAGPGSASLVRPARVLSDKVSFYLPTNQLTLAGGGMRLQGNDIATSGTIIPASGPGNEFPSLRVNYEVDVTGGGLSFRRNLGRGLPNWLDRGGLSSNLTLGAAYSSFSGDEDSRAESPSSTGDKGFLVSLLQPSPNDQTGANFGAVDIQSFGKIDIDYDRVDLSAQWLCDRDVYDDVILIPEISLGYTQWDYTFDSLDTFAPTFPAGDFFNHRAQSVDQKIFDLGIGGRFINPIGTNSGFDVFLDSKLHVYRNEAKLRSFEQFALGDPNNIDVRQLDQKKSKTNFGIDLGIGAGWNFADRWRAEVSVRGLFNTPSASIDNPVRGDGTNPGSNDLPLTGLNMDQDNQVYGGVSLSVSF